MVVGLLVAAGCADEALETDDAGHPDQGDASVPDAAPPDEPTSELVDPDATAETRALFRNLKATSASGKILFGQEFATDFGRLVDLNDDYDGSDSKDIVGQHPAVHGSDFHFFLDKSPTERAIHAEAVRQAYARGAVVTFDWHMLGRYEASFYASDANAELVAEILEDRNGSRDWFHGQLDRVIEIIVDLGFPVILRPFHEMSGDWFWWGSHVGADAYRDLFRLTVDYVKSKDVHNVLYCWATSRTAAWEYYPGDEYVDILGADGYEPGSVPWFSTEDMVSVLAELSRYAEARGKLAAFTETGHREYPDVDSDFWTKHVLAPILADPDARKIAWILTWINSSWSGPYIPYLGIEDEAAIDDFIEFFEHAATMFEDDLPPMYQ